MVRPSRGPMDPGGLGRRALLGEAPSVAAVPDEFRHRLTFSSVARPPSPARRMQSTFTIKTTASRVQRGPPRAAGEHGLADSAWPRSTHTHPHLRPPPFLHLQHPSPRTATRSSGGAGGGIWWRGDRLRVGSCACISCVLIELINRPDPPLPSPSSTFFRIVYSSSFPASRSIVKDTVDLAYVVRRRGDAS